MVWNLRINKTVEEHECNLRIGIILFIAALNMQIFSDVHVCYLSSSVRLSVVCL